jgi:hypothetical protein
VAINLNLLADQASGLSIALETELKAVREELNAVKIEDKTYKDLFK